MRHHEISCHSYISDIKSKCALSDFESLNGPSLVDLLVQWKRKSVQAALRQLTAEAERACLEDDGNLFHIKDQFARALGWHYHCLQIGVNLDELIATLAADSHSVDAAEKKFGELREAINSLLIRFADLDRYIEVPLNPRYILMRPDDAKDEFLKGNLAPSTIMSHEKILSDRLILDQIIDGILQTLNRLPWANRSVLIGNYFIKTGLRLELIDACGALSVDIATNKKALLKATKKHAQAVKMRDNSKKELEDEWQLLRQAHPIPIFMGTMLEEILKANVGAGLGAS